MSSISFDLARIRAGDTAQINALFHAAAVTSAASPGVHVCDNFAAVVPLIAKDLNNAQAVTPQLAALLQPHGVVLAAPLLVRLNVAEHIFSGVSRPLDSLLQQMMAPLLLPLLQLISRDDSFYCTPAHPAHQLLNELIIRGGSWYPRTSKPSQSLHEKLQQLISVTTANWPGAIDEQILVSELTQFRQWATAEDKRAQMLEVRLCETELANLKLRSAECRVLDLFNNTLADRLLPTAIITQMPILQAELQSSLIARNSLDHQEHQAAFWKSWQRALPLLGRVFGSNDIEIDAQQLYQDIPLLLRDLQLDLHGERSNEQYHDFVDHLIQLLMQAIQQQPIECNKFPPLAYPEGYTDNHTHVTAAILQQGQNLCAGNWFLFTGEDQQHIRCKLALKIPDADQLLFVDHSGRKVMIKSIKDFALCLSTGVAQALHLTAVDIVITKALMLLIERANENTRQQQVKAEQNLAQELGRKHAAADKAKAEAKILAEQKQHRLAAEQAAQAERQRQQRAHQEAEKNAREKAAIQLVDNLNVGAWIEISGATAESAEEKSRCKLSVIIGSTGKYIFVDHLGRKSVEYQREQLLESINQGLITVISAGDKFEDQLAKVIRGLRKDIP